MKIFSKITGNSNQISKEYNDDIVELLINSGNKRSGEKPKNLLAKILRKLGLTESSQYWNIKENIWKF